jgi:SAM-dependent methyltransferase
VAPDFRSRIIAYWNQSLLSSPVSSTSHADPDLASVDNAVENRRLGRLIDAHAGSTRAWCLDVGAGYGRFTALFLRRYTRVTLLEAAARIFATMEANWGMIERVECLQRDFESLDEDRLYDLVFTSGVLYLYPDEMVAEFGKKVQRLLAAQGLFVARDFISRPKPVTVPSAYVEGNSCYYRTPQFWAALAANLDLELLAIVSAKPRLAFLRRSRVRSVLRRLKLTRLLRSRHAARLADRLTSGQTLAAGVHTVFIVMRKAPLAPPVVAS